MAEQTHKVTIDLTEQETKILADLYRAQEVAEQAYQDELLKKLNKHQVKQDDVVNVNHNPWTGRLTLTYKGNGKEGSTNG